MLPCDVQVDAEVVQLFTEIGERWGRLDFLVHSVAYATRTS